jgi:hypothetical protein
MLRLSLWRRIEKLESYRAAVAFEEAVDRIERRSSDKDRAIKTAREVLKYEQAGITITPSETINLAREYLKSLRMSEKSS